MRFINTRLFSGLLLASLLSGCTAIAIGGATTGVAVVHDRRSTGTVIDDQTIELKSLNALYDNEKIWNNCHINITSYNGVMLLTGEAPTEALRSAIVDTVRRIPKVTRIHNELLLAAPSSMLSRSSDSYVTSKAKVALFGLEGLDDFDPTRVKVVTENGVVYLMGLLKQHEVSPVIEKVRRVGGVQRVVKLFEII